MWKSSETPRRRRLQFDPLEGRQLLSVGYFPGPHRDVAPISSGAMIGDRGPAGPAERGGWGDPAPPGGFGGWGYIVGVESGPGGLRDAGSGTGITMSPGESDWAMADGAGDPGSSGAFAPGPAGMTPSAGGGQPGAFTVTEMVISLSGASANGAMASAAPGVEPGWPGNGPSGGPGPGGFLALLARSPDAANPSTSSVGLPPPQFMPLDGLRDRADLPEPGAMPAAPLSTASAPAAPGVPSSVATVANVGTATGTMNPASQALPAGSTASNHAHPVVGDPDPSPGDSATSLAVGSPARGDARGLLARHSVLTIGLLGANAASTSAEMEDDTPRQDDAPPSPRGADLIAEALPLAGDALERGLEEFVRQLESVDMAGIVTEGPTPLVVATLSVAGAAASAMVVREVVRRRAARRSDGRLRLVDSRGRELALSFPELPRSWSDGR